jgi:hypothetical protein
MLLIISAHAGGFCPPPPHLGTLHFACVRSSTAPDGNIHTCGRRERNRCRISGTLLSVQRFLVACTPQILTPVHIYESQSMCLGVPQRLCVLVFLSVRPTRRELVLLYLPVRMPPVSSTGTKGTLRIYCLFTPNGSIDSVLVTFSVTCLNSHALSPILMKSTIPFVSQN